MQSIEKFYCIYLAVQDEVRRTPQNRRSTPEDIIEGAEVKYSKHILVFRSVCTNFAAMSRKTRHDILVKRNSMQSESPPRYVASYTNSIESVPNHRCGLSHIELVACGEPRLRMTKVCAFLVPFVKEAN